MNEPNSPEQNVNIEDVINTEKTKLVGIRSIALHKKKNHIGYSDSPEPFTGDSTAGKAPTISSETLKWSYPLHFIEAIFYDLGDSSVNTNRPLMEIIAISTCTLESEDSKATKAQTWIGDPGENSFEHTIAALFKHIGKNGTPLIRSKQLRKHLCSYEFTNPEISQWIINTLSKAIDLDRVISDYYFSADVTTKSTFQENLEYVSKKNNREYSLAELNDIVEKGISCPGSLNPDEKMLKAGYLIDYTISQLPSEPILAANGDIDNFWEQYKFGSPSKRMYLKRKIIVYSQVMNLQMLEWYNCWLKNK